jgi:hypothetical protein
LTFKATNLLTFMATIAKLLDDKALIRVTVPLARNQFHDRKLYATPDGVEWMRNDVPKMVTGVIQSATPPKDQLVLRLRQWMAGLPMTQGPMFKDLKPLQSGAGKGVEHGVWELKTVDLRLFGWLYVPREFVVTRYGYADDYKGPNKKKTYSEEIRNVMADRLAMQLNGGTFAKGAFHELV